MYDRVKEVLSQGAKQCVGNKKFRDIREDFPILSWIIHHIFFDF